MSEPWRGWACGCLAALTLVCGCQSAGQECAREVHRRDDRPDLVIVAVNSSQTRRVIETQIVIDDALVFCGTLSNLPQSDSQVSIQPHKRIELRLGLGTTHRFKAIAAQSTAKVDAEIDLSGPRWIWLGYEDWDEEGRPVPADSFAFWIRDTPIEFE